MTSRFAKISALVLFSLSTAPAHAQYSADERLNKLENSLHTLERAVYRNDTTTIATVDANQFVEEPAGAAALQVRVTELEEKLRNLQGRVEEMEHQLNTGVVAGAGVAGAEVTNPTSVGTMGATSTSPYSTLPPSEVPGTPITPDTTYTTSAPAPALSSSLTNPEQAAYDNAFSLLREKRYEEATRAFERFLADYPGHRLGSNAYYWLGETYYAQQNYEQASLSFMQSYKDFPDGNKAADSLLKLAMSLGKQGQNEQACTTLNKLESDFPQAPAALRQRMQQERQNHQCQ